MLGQREALIKGAEGPSKKRLTALSENVKNRNLRRERQKGRGREGVCRAPRKGRLSRSRKKQGNVRPSAERGWWVGGKPNKHKGLKTKRS